MNQISENYFGQNAKIKSVLEEARNIASTKATVLILGEVGSGKKTLAEYIHQHSSRAKKTIRVVDCAQDSLEVEKLILGFRDETTGHFHKGVLESGNNSTVVLANVDRLEDSFQRKIHRILLELGDYDLDIRLIYTTSKHLSKLVGSGKFYRGLYTIISKNTLSIPPIRERLDDLQFFIESIVESSNFDKQMKMDEKVFAKFKQHYWNKNFYELKDVVNNSFLNSAGVMSEENLNLGEKKMTGNLNDLDNDGMKLMSLKQAEKLLIKKALIHTSENRTQAAKILGVSIRTLRNKINEYRTNGTSFFINLR